MQATLDIYRDRIDEIELYFRSIAQLYQKQPLSGMEEIRPDFYSDDFLKMLKANALLMIYNLVESSIMGGILEIYDDMKSCGYSYNDVREEIRDIWFSFKFNQVYDKTAHYNSYREKASEIVTAVLRREIIELNRKATDISGNLDAEKIRQICKDHGITYLMSNDCRGGVVLEDVKNKRNNLAHGTISFVECGREYSIDDLSSIKDETILFLNCILDGMKTYYDEKLFLLTR
ncbi:MAE_28990/MAE_18760 family HEPN-like nuclease [uncultured Acetobacterium sp.]|jgi:hypothetical protein|uniref:MAE_28990/MAE_18760 family HEPN-like nuclease n=1 Tax=uncultured Acetobacterium sp. TaxID=217139 RepID=UPI0025E82012|nr:MAE_28990/MAE_18760 family HEPN-like nuclease [uncultured Acetobacterium sp.]